MSDELDITPYPHFLESIRGDRSGSWSVLLAEAADNSLDADATDVLIDLSPESVSVADNGRGISKDRESAIVRLGEHGSMPGTKLGRYGMGIKYNAMSAGNILEVDSTSVDGTMSLIVDWNKVVQSGRWKIPPPRWSPALPSRHGTQIAIRRLRWNAPKDKDVAAARAHMAHIFYPALVQGIRFHINGSPVNLLHEPELSDVVDHTVQLPNGKGAHVRGGILVDHDSVLYGVQVSYKHRVIKPKSSFGCGEYSGQRQMFARVALTADWGLTRFKDDLNDPDEDALEDAVADILRPILEKVHNAEIDLRVDEITDQLNTLLPENLRATRPPRKHTVTERHDKKPRTRGRSEQIPNETGPARTPPKTDNRVILVFDGPLCGEHGYGMFTKGRPHRITLAKDNPVIAALLDQRDRDLALKCLLGFALMIYQHAREIDSGQPYLPFNDDSSFGLRVWRQAERQPDIDSDSKTAIL